MSGIPGSVGAAPVQNIGAYGQELGDTFVSLKPTTLQLILCAIDGRRLWFSYRHSVFRAVMPQEGIYYYLHHPSSA